MKFGNFFGLIKPKPRFAILPAANGNWGLLDMRGSYYRRIGEYKTMKQAEKAIENLRRPAKEVD